MKRHSVSLVIPLVVLCGLQLWLPFSAFGDCACSVPVYQVDARNEDNLTLDSCYYTTSLEEKQSAVANGWIDMGIAFYIAPVQVPGTVALYRLYSAEQTDNFYTPSVAERNAVMGMGYALEGIQGYVARAEARVPWATPLRRFYYPGDQTYHLYSTNSTPRPGANDEGSQCYVWHEKRELCGVDILAPNPGGWAEVNGGRDYDVKWLTTVGGGYVGKGGYIAVYYRRDYGSSWIPIGIGLENTGVVRWRVPNVATDKAIIRIVWTNNLFGQADVLADRHSRYPFKIKPSRLPKGAVAAVARLAAPSGLAAKRVSSSEIQLSWKAPSGNPKGHIVERRTGPAAFMQVANIQAPNLAYADKNLAPGTGYTYRVCAYNANSRSSYSSEVSVQAILILKARSRALIRR